MWLPWIFGCIGCWHDVHFFSAVVVASEVHDGGNTAADAARSRIYMEVLLIDPLLITC